MSDPRDGLRAQRVRLQGRLRDYVEMIWEGGGETVTAHNIEANALLGLEREMAAFRKRLESTP